MTILSGCTELLSEGDSGDDGEPTDTDGDTQGGSGGETNGGSEEESGGDDEPDEDGDGEGDDTETDESKTPEEVATLFVDDIAAWVRER